MSDEFVPASAEEGATFDATQSGDGPTCRVCGVQLDYAGRGRPPTLCDEHKASAAKGSRSPRSTGTAGSRSTKRRRELLDTFNGIGMMTAAVDQYDAAVIVASAPRLAETLGTLADNNPAFAKFLDEGNKSVVWLQLAIALSALVIPIMAHHGVIPIDEREAFRRFHGDPDRKVPQ